MVSTFLLGSQKVYDFIHNNPQVLMMDVGYTNDPFVIAKNPRVTAINSALQIDLTGQVCADSIGINFIQVLVVKLILFMGLPVQKVVKL